jgi:hypothetical protein
MRLVIALTALNLALLGFTVSAQNRSAALRASAFELVDERGMVRARLGIKGSGTAELDLFDATGTIRVKLAADQDGSGLMLANETAQPGIHMLAKGATTHITLKGSGGGEHIIRP